MNIFDYSNRILICNKSAFIYIFINMKYLLILEILIYYVSSIDLDTCIIKDVGP